VKASERIAILSKALRMIRIRRFNHCERYTSGTCRGDRSLRRTAKYTADRWCDSCIATEALEKAAR